VSEFDGIDALVADSHRYGGSPGLAFGILRDGQLVHAGGVGEIQAGSGAPPHQDTVFRIASMTKSFTAAAMLLLRDEGALALDDLAEVYVPELRSSGVSIRHLLTMTAGFPTDDPWGDRQQGLPLDEFGAFLANGVRVVRMPGISFEYSNLGYAILGRIITSVTRTPYPDFIRDRLLLPLGMTRSGFEPPASTADLARGYRRAPHGQVGWGAGAAAAWEEVPFDPCGAFAPMGGLFTCVSDLARWVAGLAGAFAQDPPAHPLGAASRREMQCAQVPTGWDRPASFPADGMVTAYGFGLAIADDPVLGRVVGHGGGYPGFGSYMRWHPATGTGVIAFGNATYARMQPLTARIMRSVLGGYRQGEQPWPETAVARDQVNDLLVSWDDDKADRVFSPSVGLDIPFAERRQTIALIRERIGDFRPAARTPESDSPAHSRWWLTGKGGTVQAQILLTPERPPRVQSLNLAVPPAPGSPLDQAVSAIIAWMNGQGPAPLLDATLQRRLKAAAAWAGRCTRAATAAGDGSRTVTVELVGQYAPLSLSVSVEPVTGHLRQVDITWHPA
jgi:CubicO group peptidase (beta-lactamase class C family)